MKKKIGFGVFTWDGIERRTNRYGSFALNDEAFNERPVCEAVIDNAALQGLKGANVRITCKVVATRKSGHIGDQFLQIFPSTPEVGEEIELGVGTISSEVIGLMTCIRLMPQDGRNELWMDPRKLYRLHDQTVEVFVEKTTDPCSPAPILAARANGAIDNGDGTLQMKTKAPAVRVLPKVERLGDGMFMMQTIGGAAGEHFETQDISLEEVFFRDVWQVLVEHAGASKDIVDRERFVSYFKTMKDTAEFRFCGHLGFGGKFWYNRGDEKHPYYISCYPEDTTPKRAKIIDKVNTMISEMYAKTLKELQEALKSQAAT